MCPRWAQDSRDTFVIRADATKKKTAEYLASTVVRENIC